MRSTRTSAVTVRGRTPLLLVVLLGLGAIIAAGGLFVACSAGRPMPIHLELHAMDATGAPISAPVHVDGAYVGDTPVVLEEWWLTDPADLAPSVDPWPPTPPAGTRPFSRSGLGNRELKVQSAPWTEADGALVVPLRVVGAAGELRRQVRIEVGPPGARLTPTNSGGGSRQGLLSSSVTVRLGFTAN